MRLLASAAIVALAALAPAAPDQPPNVATLVEQLGSPRFADREAATKRLDELGVPALDALRAACRSENPEVARRAKELVGRIERRAASDRALAPTTVRLDAKGVPLDDALAALSKQAGCEVVLGGLNANELAGKKVTVATGEVPFWTAVLAVCDAADLQLAGVSGFVAPGSAPYYPKRAATARVAANPNRAVVLEARDGPKRPASVHGAVLVQAIEVPKVAASPAEAATVLQFWPEPKLAWQSAASLKVTRATDAAGRKLTPDLTPAAVPQVQRVGKGGVVVVKNPDGSVTVVNPGATNPLPVGPSFKPNVRQTLAKFKTGTTVARELSGSAFALVRSPVEPLATVTLDGQEAVSATGRSGVKLTAALRTDARGKRFAEVALELPDGVEWARGDGDNHTLLGVGVTDADGVAFPLSLADQSGHPDVVGRRIVTRLTLELVAAKNGPTTPAKVTFRGTHIKQVEVPFELTDVPLVGGAN